MKITDDIKKTLPEIVSKNIDEIVNKVDIGKKQIEKLINLKYVKAQLHFHTSVDPVDVFVGYSPYKAIDEAAKKGYTFLSFTHHGKFIYKLEWRRYAFEKGIILIPGVEYEIDGKHILIFNPDEEVYNIKTFQDLREYKSRRKNLFVIAPHPFYSTGFCLKDELEKNSDIFDAVEYSYFYTHKFGDRANKKVLHFCDIHSKPIVGTSDVHNLKYLDSTYCLVNVSFDISNLDNSKIDSYIKDFFSQIKSNNILLVTNPFSLKRFLHLNLFFIKGTIVRFLKKF